MGRRTVHCLIQRWQPKLNYPFVTKELVKKAHGLAPVRQQPHLQKPPDTIAKQLFKKIRFDGDYKDKNDST